MPFLWVGPGFDPISHTLPHTETHDNIHTACTSKPTCSFILKHAYCILLSLFLCLCLSLTLSPYFFLFKMFCSFSLSQTHTSFSLSQTHTSFSFSCSNTDRSESINWVTDSSSEMWLGTQFSRVGSFQFGKWSRCGRQWKQPPPNPPPARQPSQPKGFFMH